MSHIKMKNISMNFKNYSASTSLKAYFANLFSKKNNYPKIEEHKVIKNISLEIKSGEIVGIIGRNGAGKSTLLKILSRVYENFTGELEVSGKIAPLLELGTGFHPEFTGRENIHLNGTIIGYEDSDLKDIEDEVINFSELNEYIDTPVKYYSTGMYMRLAFSLATALKPDILILDEILAGGDAKFIEKASKRLENIIEKANIVILVSHNVDHIKSICNRVIYIENGFIVDDGNPDTVINKYLEK